MKDYSAINSTAWGPSIKYVTLFWPNLTPSLCHTLSHILGPPQKVRHTYQTPRFLVGLVQEKPGQKPPVQILSQLFAEFLFGGFVKGSSTCLGFVRVVFIRSPSVRI